jgi:CO/xanthine dehydrogenase FAD-binding subunit
VKPASFEYVAPRTLDEVLARLADLGDDAKLLAGGQSLVPALNLRLARPRVLIDLGRVPDIDHVRAVDGTVAIGACVRQRAAERSDVVRRSAPLLAKALPFIGHPAIRNRGTVGGSLAHADPAAELPAVVAALEADLVVASARGRRVLKPMEFFTSYLTTALRPDEMLVEVRVPHATASARVGFVEFSRRHGDFALAGVAVSLELDAGNTARAARVALFGVGPTPVRAVQAERVLTGRAITDDVVREAAQAAAKEIDPPADLHATSHYRRRLAAVLVEDAVRQALAGAP